MKECLVIKDDVVETLKTTTAESRPYQHRIVQQALTAFTDKKMRAVLVESPTGSGKTITALIIAKILHEHYNLRIGWVAMRQHLLRQVEHENRLKQFNVPLTYISMFDKNPTAKLDVLVVDEAQHDVTASMSHIHALVEPKHILGLSATPFRADRVKLCFDKVIKDAGIASLIIDGYLSPFHHYSITKWGVEDVVNHYVKDQARWGKSIMYFHRLAQCEEARRMLQERGVLCDVVSGSSDTEEQLENFAANKIHVLINCMKLTEGFDCPDLQTVFCRPSCKSVTMQMAGRVLRKHPDYPYKNVVQCQTTPYPFPQTAMPLLQHREVDGGWRTLEVNPGIDTISKKFIRALAHIPTDMPAFITKNMSAPQRWGTGRTRRRQQVNTEGVPTGPAPRPLHHG